MLCQVAYVMSEVRDMELVLSEASCLCTRALQDEAKSGQRAVASEVAPPSLPRQGFACPHGS